MSTSRIVLTAWLVAASSAVAQGVRTADPQPRPSIIMEKTGGGFDIQFEGGSLAEYVGALRRAGQATQVPVNVNLAQDAGAVRIDPIVLSGVNLGVALSTIQYATAESLSVEAVYDPSTKDGMALLAPAFVIRKHEAQTVSVAAEKLEVFQVGELLGGGGYELPTVLTAVQEALELSGVSSPEVRYHEGSMLLLVRARDSQIEAARKVVDAMRESAMERAHDDEKLNAIKADQQRTALLMQVRLKQTAALRESAVKQALRIQQLHDEGHASSTELQQAQNEQVQAEAQYELARIEAEFTNQEPVAGQDLVDWRREIAALRDEIRSLADRVAKLEK